MFASGLVRSTIPSTHPRSGLAQKRRKPKVHSSEAQNIPKPVPTACWNMIASVACDAGAGFLTLVESSE